MTLTDRIREWVKGLEDRDIYKYIAIALGIVTLLIGLLMYIYYGKVSKYTRQLQEIIMERKQAQQILSDYKAVAQQHAKIEQILTQDKNFLITKKYSEILKALGLTSHQQEEPKRTPGATVSGRTESNINSHLSGITMKQVTDLLSAIADVPQLYPKELIIRKPTPNAQTVDVDLTITTLEPETAPE
jgi:hypothetical protein